MMRLSELAALVAQLQEEAGDNDPVVKMAVQPGYPFEWSIRDLVLAGDTAYVVQGSEQEYFTGSVDEVFHR